MVAHPPRDPKDKGRLRSLILRRLRFLRGKRPPQVAAEMGILLRSYENFEAGKGRLNVDRVHHFADVLGVDAHGILAALDIGSPEFAARTADNKLMSAFLLYLQEFDRKAQDTITHLPTYALMDAFKEMFDKLAATAAAHDAAIKRLRGKRTDEDPEDEGDS